MALWRARSWLLVQQIQRHVSAPIWETGVSISPDQRSEIACLLTCSIALFAATVCCFHMVKYRGNNSRARWTRWHGCSAVGNGLISKYKGGDPKSDSRLYPELMCKHESASMFTSCALSSWIDSGVLRIYVCDWRGDSLPLKTWGQLRVLMTSKAFLGFPKPCNGSMMVCHRNVRSLSVEVTAEFYHIMAWVQSSFWSPNDGLINHCSANGDLLCWYDIVSVVIQS